MTRTRRYDLICFDWDGTLFDSTALIARCIQDAVVEVGGERPSRAAAEFVIGMALGQALAHVAPDVPPERHAALGACYRELYYQHQDDIQLFEGVLPLLAELKARSHHLAVATGKSRAGLDVALNSRQLQGVFDASRTADETAGKPNPRMLQELMAQFQVSPRRTLMVGDTSHDLDMARRADCASVAVTYGAHGHEHLLAFKPRFIAHSVPQLRHWLLEHG